jgi:cellulose synthase/poly-beta-1,6-N-acetylglucosamine synthase-like glycosyltransferase
MTEISVIIPAYNAKKTIKKCLECILSQDINKKYEVIVVDDASSDDTIKIVSKFPVKLIKQKHQGPAKARNLGAKQSKGDIIVFTDSDCLPAKNWLKELIKPFSNPEIVGVSGTYRTMNKESILARFEGYQIEERHENMKKMERIDFVGTFNCAYRKKIFFKYGGFNTKFKTSSGEDPDLSFKISKDGYKIVFQNKAFVYHYHVDKLSKYLKQKFWRAYWRILLYSSNKEKMTGDSYTSKSLLLQVLFTGLFILFLFLYFLNNYFIYFALISLIFSISLNFSTFLFLWKKEKMMPFFAFPILFLRDLVCVLGVLYGTLRIKKILNG